MNIQDKLIKKYGYPSETNKEYLKCLTVYPYTEKIRNAIPILGKALYCNKDFVAPYELALYKLIEKGLHKEIRINDECWKIRKIRGSETLLSIHSWGLAVDLNMSDNPLGLTRAQAIQKGLIPFTDEFQQVFRDCGFTCGIDFSRKDGMHFEYTKHIK